MKNFIIILIAFFTTGSIVAQTNVTDKKTKVENATNASAEKYSCPMHADVVSDKPGKCSKCGMALIKIKTYSCPMHPEVVSNKPGKCSKCNMELSEVKSKSKTKIK